MNILLNTICLLLTAGIIGKAQVPSPYFINSNQPIITIDVRRFLWSEFTEQLDTTFSWLKHDVNKRWHVFNVAQHEGKLDITEMHSKSQTVLRIAGGKLVGTNYGEWGGALMFVPSDTTLKRVDI